MWEAAWAPYDEATYAAALSHLRPDDTILDIGAGDCRFARRAAHHVRVIITIEQRFDLLQRVAPPPNLWRICADMRAFPIPHGVTAAVLLMRHCTQVGTYTRRLKAAGVQRLITNARWGLGVEVINLQAPPTRHIYGGWWACLCGATGFKPVPPEELTPTLMDTIHHLTSCNECEGHS